MVIVVSILLGVYDRYAFSVNNLIRSMGLSTKICTVEKGA